VYQSIAQTLVESLSIQDLLKLAEIEGDTSIFDSLSKETAPILVLTAHIGNWELLGAFAASQEQKLNVITVARQARKSTLQRLLEAIRQKSGVKTIWRGESASAKDILREFIPGTILAALIDQDLNLPGSFSSFFGEKAHTSDALIKLAIKRHAKIYVSFMIRKYDLKFIFYAEELKDLSSVDAILSSYHQILEKKIAQYPEQWVWFHKRWRQREDGVRLSGKEYLALLNR
jgi:KDO2-lipid IV(A) lauroyltransferase